MPEPDVTEDYIRIRQKDPGDFVEGTFRTITLSEEQGIKAVIGKLKSDPQGSTVVQTYLFDKEKWTVAEAQKWVKDHKSSIDFSDFEVRKPDYHYEMRVFPMNELRAVDGKETKIEGYAAIFNSLSEEMWGFREKIAKGAFTESIKKDDIRMLWNHDPNFVLGRTKSGTLELKEDSKGLFYRGTPPDTQWARDIVTSIKRGDINQSSFGFIILGESWDKGDEKGSQVRTLTKVKLYDVSPVTYPAYKETEVYVRSGPNQFWFPNGSIKRTGEYDPIIVLPQRQEEKILVEEDDSKGQFIAPDLSKTLVDPHRWETIRAIKEKGERK